MTESTIPYYVVSGASKYCNGSDLFLVTKDLDKAEQRKALEEDWLNKKEGFAEHPDYWVDIQTIQVPNWTDINMGKGGFLGHHHDIGDEATIFSSMTTFTLDKEIGSDSQKAIDILDNLYKDASPTNKPDDKTMTAARTFLWCHEELGIPSWFSITDKDIVLNWTKWDKRFRLTIYNEAGYDNDLCS